MQNFRKSNGWILIYAPHGQTEKGEFLGPLFQFRRGTKKCHFWQFWGIFPILSPFLAPKSILCYFQWKAIYFNEKIETPTEVVQCRSVLTLMYVWTRVIPRSTKPTFSGVLTSKKVQTTDTENLNQYLNKKWNLINILWGITHYAYYDRIS